MPYFTPPGIPKSIIDAKGDLIVGSADNTPSILASSGTNNQVLTVDTTTATGLKWATPGGGINNFPRVDALSDIEPFTYYNNITGNTLVYTVPTGYDAIFSSISAFGRAGSISWYPYYTMNADAHANNIQIAGADTSTITNVIYRQQYTEYLKSGDKLYISTNASINIMVQGWVFPTTSKAKVQVMYKTSTSGSLVTGDNTFYTVPANKNAIIYTNSGDWGSSYSPSTSSSIRSYNNSGASRTFNVFFVPNGGTAGVNNKVNNNLSVGASATAGTNVLLGPRAILTAGMSIVINVDANTATQRYAGLIVEDDA